MLHREDGTLIKELAFPATAVPDVPMRITADAYEAAAYGLGDGRAKGSRFHLLHQAGPMVPQSEIDHLFTRRRQSRR